MATRDPAFGTPAVWIEPAVRDQAEMFGYTVVEPGSVIATHLTETVRRHADEILTRDATKHLIDELKQTSPVVVDELIPGVMKLAEVQQILQMLLREGVPIRQLGRRSWRRWATTPRGPRTRSCLTEYVRHRLARSICTRYRNAENRLFVVTLDPALEDRIRAGFEHNEHGLVRPHVAAGGGGHLPADRGRGRAADAGQSSAGGAGQPADPRRLEADDRCRTCRIWWC